MTAREMTLRQYLRIHPDYRTVTRAPHRCMMVQRADEAGGATVLRLVRIVGDIVATLEAETPDGEYLVATARTQALGDQAPYFSLTGELYRRKASYTRRAEPVACGCLHEEILAAFPNLAPIEALHCSDAITGEPMHAVANGWYRYEHGEFELAAELLRVDVEDLPVDVNREEFAAWVATLADQWREEAARGRELLESLAPAPTAKPSPEGTLYDDERG